jgi:hypothetical protein
MRRRASRLLPAAWLFAWLGGACAAPEFGVERVSEDTRYAAGQVLASADHRHRPFAIVDKREARMYLFDAAGRLLGASPVLIGLATGDSASPDLSRRAPASLAPHERNTPAGRFDTQPGHNDKGEPIVWVDYAASLAIHRLRPAAAAERRPERLASPVAEDHRISFGCIVAPVAFYESQVEPLLGRQRGVVYVLPESRPVQAMFGAFDMTLARR